MCRTFVHCREATFFSMRHFRFSKLVGLSQLLFVVLCTFPAHSASIFDQRRSYEGHGNAWKEFRTLYRAGKDLGSGGQTKARHLPSIILETVARRVGALAPSAPAHKAGCIVSADQLVGTSSWRGAHDLIFKPSSDGQCHAPPLAEVDDVERSSSSSPPSEFSMLWENEGTESSMRQLPPVADVYETVFARRGAKPNAILQKEGDPALSFWFLSFVNWFHDDNFRTAPNTDGSFTWSDAGGLHMAQLYGHTPYRQRALRTMAGDGKMKTSSLGTDWDYYPPLWRDVQQEFPDFEMWTPTRGPTARSSAANKTQADVDANEEHYFAIGDPRFNMHPGHILWTSIGLYLHNTACDLLMQEAAHPHWTDEDLFQRARVMTFHIIQKIRMEEFVSDSVSHVRDHIRIPYDPPTLREKVAPHFAFTGKARPNFLEFNHVYQAWHSLIPDHLVLNGSEVPLHSTMWSPQLFHQHSLADLARSFADTPIARYGPHNFPFFVRGVTEAALNHSRAQRLPSYNAYRQHVGMEPLTSFDQLGVDDPEAMAKLYGHQIENLEFLTGIIADSKAQLPGNFMSDSQLIYVSIFAFQDLMNNAMVQNPVLWSAEYLTQAGLEWIQTFNFQNLLEDVLLPAAAGRYPCPFQTTGSQDTIGCRGRSEWKAPEEMGFSFLDSARVCSYVGVDLTEWFFYENGYSRTILLIFVASMGAVMLLYLATFFFLSHLWPMQKSRDGGIIQPQLSDEGDLAAQHTRRNDRIFFQRLRLSSLSINLTLSLVLVIPTTAIWLQFMGDPAWIQYLSESAYLIPYWTTSLVGVHFVAEIPLRLAQWRYSFDGVGSNADTAKSIMAQLTVHHLGYFFLVLLHIHSTDVAVLKMCFTVLTSWVWEWTMFLAFFSVRCFDAAAYQLSTCPPPPADSRHLSITQTTVHQSQAYRRLVLFGLPLLTALYFVTRIIEAVVLAMLFGCGLQRDVPASPAGSSFWMVSVLACVLILLQLHGGFLLVSFFRQRRYGAMRSPSLSGDQKAPTEPPQQQQQQQQQQHEGKDATNLSPVATMTTTLSRLSPCGGRVLSSTSSSDKPGGGMLDVECTSSLSSVGDVSNFEC